MMMTLKTFKPIETDEDGLFFFFFFLPLMTMILKINQILELRVYNSIRFSIAFILRLFGLKLFLNKLSGLFILFIYFLFSFFFLGGEGGCCKTLTILEP